MRLNTLVFATLIAIVGTNAATGAGVRHKDLRQFYFDNHLDTHQASVIKPNGTLKGVLYIIYTGDVDPVSGLPVARHPRGAEQGEECGVDPIDCIVGWHIRGQTGTAKYLYHGGVNGNDHPVWLVNRVDIPTPGVFNHFHWIGALSSDPRAGDVSDACDKRNASDLENQEPSAVNEFCDGWFLQLRAVRNFAFEHGGEKTPVYPGLDSNTHMNLVTNYAEVPGITATRGSSGH